MTPRLIALRARGRVAHRLGEVTVQGTRVERRLAAILPAEFAGYSRLTGAAEVID
jgi:hypothetical protein